MKILFYILLILLLNVSSVKASEIALTKNEITIFNGTLHSITGPKEEVDLLHNFPKALYKIYSIAELGSFYIDSRTDLIKDELKKGHTWDPKIVEAMKQYAKPGSIVVDIGAHIGTATLSLSKAVGNEGHVIAFEPQIKLYSELVMNMMLNKCQNVIAYRCALGDTIKEIEMCPARAGNEGATSIGAGGDNALMITLDSLNLNNVSLIKLDVENFEYEVLIGAEQTIKKNHPYMIIEIMGNTYQPIPNRQELIQKTLKKVQDMGYSLNYIDGSWSDWLAIPIKNSEKNESF